MGYEIIAAHKKAIQAIALHILETLGNTKYYGPFSVSC